MTHSESLDIRRGPMVKKKFYHGKQKIFKLFQVLPTLSNCHFPESDTEQKGNWGQVIGVRVKLGW